uniref:CCHC-type domain-containing protein n=1 Tax=Eptatretus burgeri TaxID=7764 RepID=A0A8C4NAX6_EPTBU
MVWTCAQEGSGVYREKDVEDGAARQEEKRKANEEVHGYGEGGHAGGWSVPAVVARNGLPNKPSEVPAIVARNGLPNKPSEVPATEARSSASADNDRDSDVRACLSKVKEHPKPVVAQRAVEGGLAAVDGSRGLGGSQWFQPTNISRRNTVRFSINEDFEMDQLRFCNQVLIQGLGFSPGQLDYVFALPGGKCFDVVFMNIVIYLSFWEKWEKAKDRRPLSSFAVESLCERGVVNVTIQMYIESVKDEDILLWLSRFCKPLGPSDRMTNALGIKNGARRVKVQLRDDPSKPGSFLHIPNRLSIGPFRGFVFYPGQLRKCNKCNEAGHLGASCPNPRCPRCGQAGHVVRECVESVSCNLCGEAGHVFRGCPKSFSNALKREKSRGVSGFLPNSKL